MTLVDPRLLKSIPVNYDEEVNLGRVQICVAPHGGQRVAVSKDQQVPV